MGDKMNKTAFLNDGIKKTHKRINLVNLRPPRGQSKCGAAEGTLNDSTLNDSRESSLYYETEETLFEMCVNDIENHRKKSFDEFVKKYSNIEIDDVVDLRTMTVIEDGGLLRSMKKVKFGYKTTYKRSQTTKMLMKVIKKKREMKQFDKNTKRKDTLSDDQLEKFHLKPKKLKRQKEETDSKYSAAVTASGNFGNYGLLKPDCWHFEKYNLRHLKKGKTINIASEQLKVSLHSDVNKFKNFSNSDMLSGLNSRMSLFRNAKRKYSSILVDHDMSLSTQKSTSTLYEIRSLNVSTSSFLKSRSIDHMLALPSAKNDCTSLLYEFRVSSKYVSHRQICDTNNFVPGVQEEKVQDKSVRLTRSMSKNRIK